MKNLPTYFSRSYSVVPNSRSITDEENQQYAIVTDAQAMPSTVPPPFPQQNVSLLMDDEQKKQQKSKSIKFIPLARDKNRKPLGTGSGREKSFKSLGGSMNPAGILSSFFNERQQNKRARSPKCAFLLLVIGVLTIMTAVLVKIIQPYDLIFKWKLTMAEGGEIFNLWEKPPVDLYIKIYLFNITNAAAFLAGKERLQVEQVGPYVYKELMTHENVTFNDNGTMSTNPAHPLEWQEHLSEGHKEDDEVVMLNIAMLAIAHLTAQKSYFIRMGLSTLFLTSASQPIVRMTAREFMFGYASALTSLGNTFLPNWISFEKVGLIDRMYDFSSDFETFYSGKGNPVISGLYDTYRGMKELPHWNGSHCSNIELASDGTKFPSFIQPNQTVKFFRKSMCRPINLHRTGEAEQHGSLTGYRYEFEENAFDNGAINPANKCFCRKGDCQPQGLIDVSDCYYGFPISLSYPHFMNADKGLQGNITGLEPSSEAHSSAFVIQPESGLPLSISAKVQINMHFDNLRMYPQVARFSHLTVPMLWFDITLPKLSSSLDRRFNFYLNVLPYLDIVGFWGGLSLGVALLVYAVTRATIRMSTFAQAGGISTQHNGNERMVPFLGGSTLYSNGTSRSGVYNPCELTWVQTLNEKGTTIGCHILSGPNKQGNGVVKEQEPNRHDDEMDFNEEEHAMMYTEIAMGQRKSLALELEPAISDAASSDDETDSHGDQDEGVASDTTLTISRNSTASSCTTDDDDAIVGEHKFHSKHARHSLLVGTDGRSRSFGSSGIASSFTDSNDGRLSPTLMTTTSTKYDQKTSPSISTRSTTSSQGVYKA